MPVLPQEPGLFPGSLFDCPESPESAGRLWWLIHTRPRQEKSLARQLYRRQIPFYLPLIARRWRSRGRRMTSYVPLFSSYVFLLADGEERIAALEACPSVGTLEVPDQQRLWRELRQIEHLIATGAPITPEDRLAPGKEVEIRSGLLAGLRGTVLRTASGRRFVVRVDFIQRGASVLVDDFALTPLH